MPDTLTFDSKQISDVLKRSVSEYKSEVSVQEVGEVIDCGDGIARIKGLPNCMAEEMLEFPNNIFGMALNLEKEQVGVMILGDFTEISEGDLVKRTGRPLSVPVGDELLGPRRQRHRPAHRRQRPDQHQESSSHRIARAERHRARTRQATAANRV